MEVDVAVSQVMGGLQDLSRRVDERHSENVQRMREIRDDVKEMKADVKETNGGIARAKESIAMHEQRIQVAEGHIDRLFSTSTGVVKVADLRIYVLWGMGCASAAVGATLWVLKVAGKL